MAGRHEYTSGWGPAAVARAVRGWFETLPFHRGMSLLGAAILVPAAAIGGTVILGGGGSTPAAARPPSARPAATPSRSTHAPRVAPTAARTAHRSLVIVKSTPRAARTAAPEPTPSSTTTCPTEWREWRWLWDLCRHGTRRHRGR